MPPSEEQNRASLEGGIFLSARIAQMTRIATIPKNSHVVRSISRQSFHAGYDSPMAK